MAEDVNT